jgi:hypothetical protein
MTRGMLRGRVALFAVWSVMVRVEEWVGSLVRCRLGGGC